MWSGRSSLSHQTAVQVATGHSRALLATAHVAMAGAGSAQDAGQPATCRGHSSSRGLLCRHRGGLISGCGCWGRSNRHHSANIGLVAPGNQLGQEGMMERVFRCAGCHTLLYLRGETDSSKEIHHDVTCPACREVNDVLWPIASTRPPATLS